MQATCDLTFMRIAVAGPVRIAGSALKLKGERMLTEDVEARIAKAAVQAQWWLFRDAVKPLCCREKLRPKHWQRALYEYFEAERIVAGLPDDRGLIERTIGAMMQASRPWCNPELFDEAGARAALQRALAQILETQVSTGTSVQLVGDVELPSPVDVAARTAALAAEFGL